MESLAHGAYTGRVAYVVRSESSAGQKAWKLLLYVKHFFVTSNIPSYHFHLAGKVEILDITTGGY